MGAVKFFEKGIDNGIWGSIVSGVRGRWANGNGKSGDRGFFAARFGRNGSFDNGKRSCTPLRNGSGEVSTNSLCSVKVNSLKFRCRRRERTEKGCKRGEGSATPGAAHIHYGEFDPGSERTLAAWIRHASRARIWETKFSDKVFRRKAAEG